MPSPRNRRATGKRKGTENRTYVKKGTETDYLSFLKIQM